MGYVSVNELDDAIESSDRDSQLFRSAKGPWRLDCLHVLSIEVWTKIKAYKLDIGQTPQSASIPHISPPSSSSSTSKYFL
jgi:hypothetical protein